MKKSLLIKALLKQKRRARHTWPLVAGLALLLVVSPAFAVTPVSSCVDISQSGSYQLTTDLTNCSISINANNVDFDLNGHTIAGGIGIFPLPWPPPTPSCSGYISGVVIRNGKLPVGQVGVYCATNIRVTSIQLLKTNVGISGYSVSNSIFDSNVITCVPATGYPNPDVTDGMIVNSCSNNQFFLNDISGCSYGIQFGYPFSGENDGNQFLENKVTNNEIGIMVSGNNNTFANNKADQNGPGPSIYIYHGTGNLILSNDAKPGAVVDNSTMWGGGCGSNIWLNNTFKAANLPCIQ